MGTPSRSAESTEPQPQASLFPRRGGTSPSQCYAAGQGHATHLSLSGCVHTCPPAQLPGPSPLQEGRAAQPPHAAFTHMGPQEGRGVEACPDSPAGPRQRPVTPGKAAGPVVPNESRSLPRGTSSGGAGVSLPIRHPQSSHPARTKNSEGIKGCKPRLRGHVAWVQIPALPLMGCMTSDKLLNVSQPPLFLSARWDDSNSTCLIDIVGIK